MAQSFTLEQLRRHEQTQKAILNLIQAILGFDPSIDTGVIIKAVGDAKTPNAVSIAARHRLPWGLFNPESK